MKTIVVDASFAGAWLLPDETSEQADTLLERIVGGTQRMAVPDLWLYEMSNLLLSAYRRSRIDEEQIVEAQDLLDAVPYTTYDHRELLVQNRLVRVAVRFELSVYDVAYVELADRLQCPLRTGDRRLYESAASLGLAAEP